MTYKSPLLLRNAHLQTIYPSLFRKLDDSFLTREVIDTNDGDFISLDRASAINPGNRVIILSHGLEGHSRRPYILGMAEALRREGWDIIAWNFRSCGGVMNKKLRFYHSGATEDLEAVINYAKAQGYEKIGLVGFSMGGNLSLVYLGEQKESARSSICGAIVFSVPCDLAASAEALARPGNSIYMKRFLRDLRKKISEKKQLFPEMLDDSNLHKIKNFREFDDRFTAPIHGFIDAEDYWQRCSSKHFIKKIRVPTVIVNASNDPFLAPACYPHKEVDENPLVKLETPASGGHVGFVSFNRKNFYWSEQRAAMFFKSYL
ncbi:MAG: alpha/beta fold hydrolase [Hahellaceae bacterium]|nr:alpha/beta fold hydrolase [Hahellaceae bacterium]MCP5211965.1 alpha/beta fold hydrolase [Hahellaceae bacterium]